MLLVPLNGYLFSNAKDVVIWGTNVVLPPLIGADKGLADLGRSAHFWLSYTFLAFILLHSLDQRKYGLALLHRSSKAIAKATP